MTIWTVLVKRWESVTGGGLNDWYQDGIQSVSFDLVEFQDCSAQFKVGGLFSLRVGVAIWEIWAETTWKALHCSIEVSFYNFACIFKSFMGHEGMWTEKRKKKKWPLADVKMTLWRCAGQWSYDLWVMCSSLFIQWSHDLWEMRSSVVSWSLSDVFVSDLIISGLIIFPASI